jgi:hypothetical protein
VSEQIALRVVDLGIPGVRATRVGLELVGDVDRQEWEAFGVRLGTRIDALRWWLADYVFLSVDVLYGEEGAQLAEATGLQPGTLEQYARVAREVPRSRRRPELSFTHHQLVAARAPAEQSEWLERAVANRWSVPEMRAAMQRDLALPARPRRSRAEVEYLELVQDVARLVCEAAEPLDDGRMTVPGDLIGRLRNALSEEWR